MRGQDGRELACLEVRLTVYPGFQIEVDKIWEVDGKIYMRRECFGFGDLRSAGHPGTKGFAQSGRVRSTKPMQILRSRYANTNSCPLVAAASSHLLPVVSFHTSHLSTMSLFYAFKY